MQILSKIMAKPIKDTPVLKGKDAKKFIKNLKQNTQRPNAEEVAKIKANFSRLQAIANF